MQQLIFIAFCYLSVWCVGAFTETLWFRAKKEVTYFCIYPPLIITAKSVRNTTYWVLKTLWTSNLHDPCTRSCIHSHNPPLREFFKQKSVSSTTTTAFQAHLIWTNSSVSHGLKIRNSIRCTVRERPALTTFKTHLKHWLKDNQNGNHFNSVMYLFNLLHHFTYLCALTNTLSPNTLVPVALTLGT